MISQNGAVLTLKDSFLNSESLDICVIMYLIRIILYIYEKVVIMVKNNIEVDVKVKCIETGKTQVQIAEEIGTTSQYVNRITKKKEGVINNTFVQMMESLGYDIEITYVKRGVE